MGSRLCRAMEPGCKRERFERRARRLRVGMIGESAMLRRFSLLLSTAAVLAIAAPAFAQDDEDSTFIGHEHRTTEGLNRAQLEYGVMPRPNPHWRWYWDPDYGRWVWRRSGYAPVIYGQPLNSARARSSDASASKEG